MWKIVELVFKHVPIKLWDTWVCYVWHRCVKKFFSMKWKFSHMSCMCVYVCVCVYSSLKNDYVCFIFHSSLKIFRRYACYTMWIRQFNYFLLKKILLLVFEEKGKIATCCNVVLSFILFLYMIRLCMCVSLLNVYINMREFCHNFCAYLLL